MAEASPNYIIERCKTLKGKWSTRKKKFEDWYDILLLKDELEQEGMESVATNDPRTGFNLARHLLTTMIIANKIPSENLLPEQIAATSYLESFVVRMWAEQEKRYRSIGRQGWLSEAVMWLLATGWYSVFAMADDKNVWAEVWSPAECYPDFGPDGLVEHAHIYTLSPGAANRKLKVMGWNVSRPFTSDAVFYNHWAFDADGDAVNAVVAGTEFVKKPVKDLRVSKVGRLPIFTSPAGGLPDMGSIKTNKEWQGHYGESIVATNEELNHNYNKMRSFYQQAARNVAQHHWLELSQGETPIATDAAMALWGSVLHGQVGEDVRAIQPPALPVELTNIMFTYRNELERGLFPAAVHGNVQQQMSYLALANAASAAMQVLTPYKNGIEGLVTDVNNFWTDIITMNELNPRKFKTPDNMPDREDRLFDVTGDLEIPGYLVQKATVSRMLNPQFKLPEAWIMEKLFPEIKDALKAQADVRKESAFAHPKAIIVDSILAYREQARVLRKANNVSAAELYEKLAKSLEAELEIPQQPSPRPTGEGVVPREVMPAREALSPLEGMGRIG